MGTLSVAIEATTFIVVRKATASAAAASIIGAGWLAFACALWFGLMLLVRHRERTVPRPESDSSPQPQEQAPAGA